MVGMKRLALALMAGLMMVGCGQMPQASTEKAATLSQIQAAPLPQVTESVFSAFKAADSAISIDLTGLASATQPDQVNPAVMVPFIDSQGNHCTAGAIRFSVSNDNAITTLKFTVVGISPANCLMLPFQVNLSATSATLFYYDNLGGIGSPASASLTSI
jgi:ABC-type glycerol-3-phosphate transport system substrate-binding protein